MISRKAKKRGAKGRDGINRILRECEKEILVFLLNMKFGSIEDVFEEVFMKRDMSRSSTQKYVKRMLEDGLVGSQKGLDGTMRNWYFGTRKGYFYLSRSGVNTVVPKSNQKIWAGTFFHDQKLLVIRRKILNFEGAKKWISERYLSLGIYNGLFKEDRRFLPDGICLINGVWWAIEYEYSNKTPKRYEEKIYKFIEYMEKEEDSKFQKVLFLVTNQYQLDVLSEICEPYQRLIKVLLLDDFLLSEKIGEFFRC